MGTKTRRALWILAGGVAAPLVSRLLYAAWRGDVPHEIDRWIDHWSRWPLRDAVVGWLWFLLPFGLLAGASALTESNRPARWAVLASAWAAFLGGIYCSVPVSGHGYRFYLGEAAFPIIAGMFLPIPLLIGGVAGWVADRRARSIGG